VPQLQRLRAEHEADLLAFELANRSYFADWVSDRGDAYFDGFAEEHTRLLAAQETGCDAYYVLVDDDGSILARVNLYDIDDGAAELGYRVAQRAAGRGVATAAVRDMCELAASEHGLRRLRARTTLDNLASQKVLSKAGFNAVGRVEVGGRAGTRYERSLSVPGRARKGRR
jgi:ribosomal-protein-alanine N-acetyltransferase